jgi:Replication initiator protein A
MALSPERHPVRDFFVLDVLDVAPRSDMASMAHPIFSLSTKPDGCILRYENDGVIVEIHPSSKGLATIFDKDILIYAVSKLTHRQNQNEKIGPNVRITTHDLLVSTNRDTEGIAYERLENALDRLAGTRIKTSIETGDERTTHNFGLIDSYDYNRRGSGFAERLRYLDIKLWLFRAIEAMDVKAISRDYFRLRSPLASMRSDASIAESRRDGGFHWISCKSEPARCRTGSILWRTCGVSRLRTICRTTRSHLKRIRRCSGAARETMSKSWLRRGDFAGRPIVDCRWRPTDHGVFGGYGSGSGDGAGLG